MHFADVEDEDLIDIFEGHKPLDEGVEQGQFLSNRFPRPNKAQTIFSRRNFMFFPVVHHHHSSAI